MFRMSGSDRRRRQRGFTLIELGVVMAILAILVAIAVPTYAAMVRRARIAEAQQAWAMVKTELWTYFVENDAFPSTTNSWWNGLDEAPKSGYWSYRGTTGAAGDTATMTAEHGNEKVCWTLDEDGSVTEGEGGSCP